MGTEWRTRKQLIITSSSAINKITIYIYILLR